MPAAGIPHSRLSIAVVGAGVSGLGAAWLLSQRHRVTLYEAADRLGGHVNTLAAPRREGGTVPVDTGFIVYNEANYPNLVALFDHLGVRTQSSDMSFAVSLEGGGLEYGSTSLLSLFAQKRNLFRPRFWAMLRDLKRFYKEAPDAGAKADPELTLGDFLQQQGYGKAFQDDHLLPQAAAIWSASAEAIKDYPFSSFVAFFDNHGLLELNVNARPQWRTVTGGSNAYLPSLCAPFAERINLSARVSEVARHADGVDVRDVRGQTQRFDHIVIAAHAPQALALLVDPSLQERALLGAMRYTDNTAVLHTDVSLMPRRRSTWSAWNYVAAKGERGEVTYWMNRLQRLGGSEQYLVSLNPPRPPKAEAVIATERYQHPHFDPAAAAAQSRLWSLQGLRRTWFCGAYFGAGFHEDALQSGLAVAEALGGVRRPWTIENESSRIVLTPQERAA